MLKFLKILKEPTKYNWITNTNVQMNKHYWNQIYFLILPNFDCCFQYCWTNLKWNQVEMKLMLMWVNLTKKCRNKIQYELLYLTRWKPLVLQCRRALILSYFLTSMFLLSDFWVNTWFALFIFLFTSLVFLLFGFFISCTFASTFI